MFWTGGPLGPPLRSEWLLRSWCGFCSVRCSGSPPGLESVFQTLASATTLAMVFVIQHTQSRAQAATQRKLDEILRASPEADNSLITLEEAPDNELKAATDAHRDVRRGCA
jgi:hypothetical protein